MRAQQNLNSVPGLALNLVELKRTQISQLGSLTMKKSKAKIVISAVSTRKYPQGAECESIEPSYENAPISRNFGCFTHPNGHICERPCCLRYHLENSGGRGEPRVSEGREIYRTINEFLSGALSESNHPVERKRRRRCPRFGHSNSRVTCHKARRLKDQVLQN